MLTAILIVVSILLCLFILRFIVYPFFVSILDEDGYMTYDELKKELQRTRKMLNDERDVHHMQSYMYDNLSRRYNSLVNEYEDYVKNSKKED